MEFLVTGKDGRSARASLIALFDRDTLQRTEAPTVRNLAIAQFESDSAIERIAYVLVGACTPLFLMKVGEHWYDVKANLVTVWMEEAE